MYAFQIFGMSISANKGGVTCQIQTDNEDNTKAELSTIQPGDQDTAVRELLKAEIAEFQNPKGVTHLTAHHIRLRDSRPIKQRYYPRNPKMQAIINEEVDRMLKEQIIEKSTSAWSSPNVMVQKEDGKHRFCIDFRELNKVSKKDAYPIPYITDILEKMRSKARILASSFNSR